MNIPENSPPWLVAAWKEIGVHEVGNNAGPNVQRYIDGSHCGEIGWPWCAIFVNYCLEISGIKGTRSASSQSFRHSTDFNQLNPGPALGAIAVFYRGGRNSGLGHVGFYCGERNGAIWVLGGNESDQVMIEAFPKSGNSFGLWGYWWPQAVSPPTQAPIIIGGDVPSHIAKVT